MEYLNQLLSSGPFVILIVTVIVFLYLFPAWIASRKLTHDARIIFWLNLLLGWTVFVWALAFFWAFMSKDHRIHGRIYPFLGGEAIDRPAYATTQPATAQPTTAQPTTAFHTRILG